VRILIAEDDAVSRRLLQAVLEQWGYDVVVACDGAEAWAALGAEDPPSLAILDWVMPVLDGVEVCRRLRADAERPYVYTILLTGRTDTQDVIEGLDAGADDYVRKPFDSNELRVRLRAGRRIIELQSVLLDTQRILRDRATHDPLTGMWNRAQAIEALDRELVRGVREGTPVSILMADLDHFKAVNDGFGHMAGDAVLREIALRIRSSLRPYDVVGRYGGEEFLIVLPGCDAESVRPLAERVRAMIAARVVDTSEGIVPVTVSIGAATSGVGARTNEELIRAADAALYRAKAAGRDRVVHAEAGDGAPGSERVANGVDPERGTGLQETG
jgi:two-component system cell cycle response regulator